MTPDHASAEYGGHYVFNYKGMLFEVTTRLCENALKRVYETINGQFEIIPNGWTINGYYTFTYASEISCVKPLWDPHNFIEETKKLIYPYPMKLKKKIIEEFGARMNGPLNNREYGNAIARRDLLMINWYVRNILLNMVQVVYALNNAYFTGDKQIARKLAAMPYCPTGFLENLELLLGAPDDRDELSRQRDMLLSITGELNEKCGSLIWNK